MANFQLVESKQKTGPLSALYNSQYDTNSLVFPEDLGSGHYGHIIAFHFNVSNRSEYKSQDTYKYPGGKTYSAGGLGTSAGQLSTMANKTLLGGLTGKSIIGGAVNQIGGLVDALGNLAGLPKNGVIEKGEKAIGDLIKNGSKYTPGISSIPDNFNLGVGKKTTRVSQTVCLYMPDSINYNYTFNYDNRSLTEALGMPGMVIQNAGAVGSVTDAINSKSLEPLKSRASDTGFGAETVGKIAEKSAFGGGAGDFIMNAAGFALNEQLSVLFKGVGFRRFQMAFKFIPKSASESIAVDNIINCFTFHAHPEIIDNDMNSMGRYFINPSEIDIEFLHNGKPNDRIPKVGTLVISGIQYDPSPKGWTTFVDGSPNIRTLTIDLTEIEILTKQRITALQ